MKRAVVVSLVVALLLGVATAGALGVRTSRQATADPAYCSGCHADTAEHVADHLELACQECHERPESAVGLALAASWGLGDVPEHGAATEGACAACHESIPGPSQRLLTSTAGHRSHADADVTCGGCHDASIHDPELTAADSCNDCHEDVPMMAAAVATDDCVGCHVFSPDLGFLALADGTTSVSTLPDPAAEERLDRAGWGADVVRQRAHGAADCRSCHNPHSSADPTGAGDAPECTTCHRGELSAEVAAGPEGHAKTCLGCHAVHAPRSSLATACTTCHAPAATNPRATAGVGEWVIREGGVHTTAQTTAVEAMTHEGECAVCHRPHVLDATEQDCRVCHEEDAVSLDALPAGTHDSCLGCHAPHAPSPTSASCTAGCHAPIQAETVGNPAAHQRCLSCHAPHAGEEVAVGSCDGCHGALVSSPGAIHEGACLDCHSPHQAAGGVAGDCASCHQDIRAQVAAHDCSGCHQPHIRAELAATQCVGCHSDTLVAARTWPAGSPHAAAGECASCHRAHQEASPVACASCHAEQAVPRHVGAHEACADCHAPHRPVPQVARGWEQRCAACHAQTARQVFAASGVHGTCQGCHETPGPPLPQCASCHGPTSLELSHRLDGHVDAGCDSCHEGHSVATPTQGTCFACHGELRQSHFPDAPTCLSCHPFAGDET